MASSKTIRIAPQSLNASLRLRKECFLPPFYPSRCACALEASQTRPRVPCGAFARASRARARVLAAYNRGGVPLRRPVQSGPPDASRALSARLTSAATGLARLLVLARRRPSLKERRRGGGCCGGYKAGGGGGSTAAKDKAAVRAPSDPTGGGGPSANRLGSKLPLGPGSGERPGRPSLPSGVAFAPVAMAPQGTDTSGSSSSAAASPSRTFRGGWGEGTRIRCRRARGARPLTRRAAAPDAQRGRREDAAGAGWGPRGRGLDWAGPR